MKLLKQIMARVIFLPLILAAGLAATAMFTIKVMFKPADLEAWARLGALGPSWRETTENKWRHITKPCANRAMVMRELLDVGLEPDVAADLADSLADRLATGEPVTVSIGSAAIELDPGKMELE